MKTVSACQANHEFSELFSRVERGEEILITKRSHSAALDAVKKHRLGWQESDSTFEAANDRLIDEILPPT